MLEVELGNMYDLNEPYEKVEMQLRASDLRNVLPVSYKLYECYVSDG